MGLCVKENIGNETRLAGVRAGKPRFFMNYSKRKKSC
jgi:hypothetical protein